MNTIIPVSHLFRLGSEAYMKGKTEADNPFHNTKPEYKAWEKGFRDEKEYWESACSKDFNVNVD